MSKSITIRRAIGAAILALACGPAWAAPEDTRAVIDMGAAPAELAFRYDTPPLVLVSTSYSTAAPGFVPPRDSRIDDLALALNNDVDRIYEYVRNHIRTTPSFGLTKGAFGAMLDGYGTPFDQADLMVQLVRAAGGTANYVYGQVTIDGTTFSQWFGPTTAQGACELLAGGGIPAQINSSSVTNCANYSGGLTTVSFQHMWVSAVVGGQTYIFDPSFKRSIWHSGVSGVHSAIASPTGWRAAGGTSGTTSGVAHMTGYTAAARDSLRTTLNGFASGVDSAINTAENAVSPITPNFAGATPVTIHQGLSMEAVAGGSEIIRAPAYHANQARRDTSYTIPGASSVQTSNVSTHAQIPASMRTYVRLLLTSTRTGAGVAETGPLDASALAGRRIATQRDMAWTVDESVIATRPSGSMALPWWIPVFAYVAIDHPYAAQVESQPYGDATYRWQISNGTPFYFGISLGQRGNGAEIRNTSAVSRSGGMQVGIRNWCQGNPPPGGGTIFYPGGNLTPISGTTPTCQSAGYGEFCALPGETDAQFSSRVYYASGLTYALGASTMPVIPEEHEICNEGIGATLHWHAHAQRQGSRLAALESFLTQASGLLDVYDGLASGRRVQHHLIGVASANLTYGGRGNITSDYTVLDFGGTFAYARLNANARGPQAYAFATASGLSALERLVLQSQSDAPAVNGAAAMFDWFVTQPTSTAVYSQAFVNQQGSAAQRRFFDADATQVSSVSSLLFGDMTFTSRYTAAGYRVVLPQSGALGPARRTSRRDNEYPGGLGAFIGTQSPPSTSNYIGVDDHLLRNPGFLAYRVTGSRIAIAPVAALPCIAATGCFSGLVKGSGGGDFPSEIEAPVAGRDALDERYETWATAFNVDMRTGGLTLTAPADMSVGAGSYPFSLAFNRTYSSDRGATGPFGWGWTHNFDISLETGTDIGAALGEHAPRQALATLVAGEATLALFDSGTVDLLRDNITAQLVMAWWSDQVYDNQAMIRRGSASERFFFVPTSSGGRFEPEPGSTATLTRSGARTVQYLASTPPQQPYLQGHPDHLYASVSEAFNRTGWSFNYANAGVTEQFVYRLDYTHGDYEPSDFAVADGGVQYFIGSTRRFRPVSTVFPFGITVRYTYDSNTHLLTSIRSTRTNDANFIFSQINLGYAVNSNSGYQPLQTSEVGYHSIEGYGPRYRLNSISGGGATASFSFANAPHQSSQLASVTDRMGETTSYIYSDIPILPGGPGVASRLRLTEIRLPHAPSTAFTSFAYDSEARVRTVTNARPASWSYFIGEGARGRMREPDGWNTYSYYYDPQGRLFATTNTQDAVFETDYDGLGRTIRSRAGYASHFAGGGANPGQRYEIVETYYDAFHNPVLSRTRTRTSSTGDYLSGGVIDTVTEYNYPTFRHLPTRSLDANGRATRFCYHTSQSGCSGVQSAGHDGLQRGVFGPSGEETLTDYDGYGRVSRVRVRAD